MQGWDINSQNLYIYHLELSTGLNLSRYCHLRGLAGIVSQYSSFDTIHSLITQRMIE